MKLSIMDYLKILIRGRAVLQSAIDQEKIVKSVADKSSLRSTEFILSVLTGLGAVLAQAGGVIPPPYGTIVASVAAALYAISRGLAKNADPLGGVKPGLSTTELIATVLAQIASIAAAASGAVKPEVATVLLTISSGAYGLSRGLAKGGAQPEETPAQPEAPAQQPAQPQP